MPDEPVFDGVAILQVLVQHGVGLVVIGGWAAIAQGSPLPTRDVDIVPDADAANLATTHGDLDISFTPSGTQGYADLRRDAVEVVLRGTPVRLADVIRSKEAAGRDKDRRALPVLRELLATQLRARHGR